MKERKGGKDEGYQFTEDSDINRVYLWPCPWLDCEIDDMSEPVTVEELREAMAFALVEGHTEGGRYLIDTVNGWQVWARVDETGSMMIAQFSTAEFDEQNASLDAKAPDLQRHHTTLLRALDEAMGLLKDLTQSRGWLLGDTERVSAALDNADAIIARYEEAER